VSTHAPHTALQRAILPYAGCTTLCTDAGLAGAPVPCPPCLGGVTLGAGVTPLRSLVPLARRPHPLVPPVHHSRVPGRLSWVRARVRGPPASVNPIFPWHRDASWMLGASSRPRGVRI